MVSSCNHSANSQMDEDEVWKLGWRMIENSMNENFEFADLQFDSLYNFSEKIDLKFLITGLDMKSELGKNDEVEKILNGQTQEIINQICKRQFTADLKPCLNISNEQVENEKLQLEIIKMYVDDQAVRGNLMTVIISKYNLDTAQIANESGMSVDA